MPFCFNPKADRRLKMDIEYSYNFFIYFYKIPFFVNLRKNHDLIATLHLLASLPLLASIHLLASLF
jgi:hypothetical protein